MCVKSCPSNDSNPVDCHEPSFFDNNYKFKNCEYYPYAYEYSNGSIYYGDPLRYDTISSKNSFDNSLSNGKVLLANQLSIGE